MPDEVNMICGNDLSAVVHELTLPIMTRAQTKASVTANNKPPPMLYLLFRVIICL